MTDERTIGAPAVWAVILFVGCIVLVGGCGKRDMKSFNTVRLQIDENVVDGLGELPTFRLDLIGLRPENANDEQLRALDASSYYGRENQVAREDYLSRRQAVSFTLRRDSEREQILDNVPWQTWREEGVRELMIVDELHSALSEEAGQVGPVGRRRVFVTLFNNRWKSSDNVLTIHIRRAGVDFHPQPQPPK